MWIFLCPRAWMNKDSFNCRMLLHQMTPEAINDSRLYFLNKYSHHWHLQRPFLLPTRHEDNARSEWCRSINDKQLCGVTLRMHVFISVTRFLKCLHIWSVKQKLWLSILLIPLWLKLLHPWNGGIHGYIRSHAKGCSTIALFFCCSHLSRVHHLLRKKEVKNQCPSQRFGDWVLQMRFPVNRFNKVKEDRLSIEGL